MSGEPVAGVPDLALRSALELAVGYAAAGAKSRPQLSFPVELKRFLRFQKLPPMALSQVRAAVEGDDDFRRRLASVATAELVDQVGMLWLARPDGWIGSISDALRQTLVDDDTAKHREERRRHAAEEKAARARDELLSLHAELERERAARTAVAAEAQRLNAELEEVRHRLREAQRSEHAAAQALARAESELSEARSTPPDLGPPLVVPSIDAASMRSLIDGAVSASSELVRLLTAARDEIGPLDGARSVEHVPPARVSQPPRRKPIRLPGGVLAGSVESAEFLLHVAGAKTLVDGYNVAKLGWPSLDLDHQREQCIIAAENLAKRWNIAMTIVFDGAAVAGAHASKRRRVRIVYSPAGVSADDVLRDEVAAASPGQPVVVVTNDRAIVADVIGAGGNSLPSDAFLAVSRH